MARQAPPKDPRGPHARLYNDIQGSHAWLALSFTEQALYIAIRRQLNTFNNGSIEATVEKLAAHNFTSKSTIFKSLRALVTVGLIEKTRQGLMTHGGKTCSLYRFTDIECFDIPKKCIAARKATNEWKCWKTRHDAIEAVAEAHEQAVNPTHPNRKNPAGRSSAKNTSKVRDTNRSGSPDEPETPLCGSPAEPCQATPVRLANHANDSDIGRKPASLLDIALARAAEHSPPAWFAKRTHIQVLPVQSDAARASQPLAALHL